MKKRGCTPINSTKVVDYGLTATLSSLTRLRNDRHSIPPATFTHLEAANKRSETTGTARCLPLQGVGQGKDQAKVEYLRERNIPIPFAFLVDEALREQLQDALLLCVFQPLFIYGASFPPRVGFYLYQLNRMILCCKAPVSTSKRPK